MSTRPESIGRISCVHLLPTTEQAGAETRARELLGGLSATERFDLELAFYLEGRAHGRFEDLGIPLRRLGLRGGRLAFDLPRLAYRLATAYRSRPPAILHTWLTNGNLVGLLAARRWPETRVVITQCGGRGEEVFMRHHLRLQRLLIGRADHAISNSEEGAEVLARWGMPEGRISVVHNGISPERVAVSSPRGEVRERLGIPDGTPLIATGLRANNPYSLEQKNVPGLLSALQTVRERRPDSMLLLVGTEESELRRFGVGLPSWSRSVGFVPGLADFLAAADVVALASNAEGNSNVAGEALLLGLPVATTDAGDHGAVVELAGGRTVPVGDMRALGDEILALLDDPPDPHRVRQAAARELSPERMVAETVDVYDRLLAQPRRNR